MAAREQTPDNHLVSGEVVGPVKAPESGCGTPLESEVIGAAKAPESGCGALLVSKEKGGARKAGAAARFGGSSMFLGKGFVPLSDSDTGDLSTCSKDTCSKGGSVGTVLDIYGPSMSCKAEDSGRFVYFQNNIHVYNDDGASYHDDEPVDNRFVDPKIAAGRVKSQLDVAPLINSGL